MFTSQQGLWRHMFVQDVSTQSLVKKTGHMTGSINHWRGVVVHAVLLCLPTSMKLRVSHSAKKINHTCTIARRIVISLGSVNTVTKNDLQLMCLKKSKAQSLTGAEDCRLSSTVKPVTCKHANITS